MPSFRGNTKAKMSNVLPEINVTDEEKDIMKLSVLGPARCWDRMTASGLSWKWRRGKGAAGEGEGRDAL